ncbi:MAG: hypothetical protein JXR83_05195 [Deltaproteobacteria bacterium]|nr:hypothetical protein [Deltaproteobacteria bacterium]
MLVGRLVVISTLVGAIAACAMPASDAGDCNCNCSGDNACGGEQDFVFLVNGVLSNQFPTMSDVDVSAYREIVVYVEQASDDCVGGNGSEYVDVVFKVDDGSPVGQTGQGFQFVSGGGRFRVDGVAIQLLPRCDGVFFFNYTIAGVACVSDQ